MRRPASTSSELDIQRLAELAELDQGEALGLVVDLQSWIESLGRPMSLEEGPDSTASIQSRISRPQSQLRLDIVQPGLDALLLFGDRLDSEGRLRVAAIAPGSSAT